MFGKHMLGDIEQHTLSVTDIFFGKGQVRKFALRLMKVHEVVYGSVGITCLVKLAQIV